MLFYSELLEKSLRLLRAGALMVLVVLQACAGSLGAQQPAPLSGNASVLIGVNRDFPPYEYLDDKGRPTGYDVELVHAVARVMGMEVRIKADHWNVIREDLQAGRIQALAGMLYSKERSRLVEFSAPHLVVHYSIFVGKGTKGVATLGDLRTLRVAVERGSQMHDHLVANGMAAGALLVDSEPEALRALAAGQCDAALAPHIEGLLQIARSRLDNLQPVGAPVFQRELCFAAAKGNKDLQARFDTGLAILHRTGEYRKIYEKWFGQFEKKSTYWKDILKTAAWLLAPAILLVVGVLLWNRSLRQQVLARTRALDQALADQQEAKRFLQTLLDNLPVAMFVKDPAAGFTFTHWNARSEALFGLTREDVVGRTAYDLFTKEQAAGFEADDRLVIAENRLLDIPEETAQTKCHGSILLHTIKAPIPDKEGRPRFLLAISEDITQRKLMERQLQQSRISLAEAQRMAQLGNWEWDLEEDKVQWSEELFRILGLDPLLAAPSFEDLMRCVHPQDRARFDEAFFQALACELSSALDCRILLPAGAFRHVHATLQAQRQSSGRVVKVLGTCQDITDRRNAEENLRQAQKLEGLGVLAGGIAHDFNNLLTTIKANLNLAGIGVDPSSPVAQLLGNAELAVARAADLTRQMLAYAGRGSFVVDAMDLNLLVQEIAHLLKVSISKSVQLVFTPKNNLPSMDGDAAQIQQLVMNLVTNASEAIGDRAGHILISTDVECLGAERIATEFAGQDLRPGTYVTLEVLDDGCGMDEVLIARIFEPFFTTKFSGRGLGLSALQGIVRGHHGGMAIDSAVGRGTRFRIYFPVGAISPCELPKAEEAGKVKTHSGTILLVEDEDDLRFACRTMLGNLGYEVLEAIDGLDAVEKYRENQGRIAAVLMDLTMPRMGGREALREIHALNPEAKVVLCSGFSAVDAEDELRSGAIAGFLAKPYGFGELKRLLGELLA